ncbi:hypothetical protein ACWCZ5_33610 [Streptomyces sp. NPDC001667]
MGDIGALLAADAAVVVDEPAEDHPLRPCSTSRPRKQASTLGPKPVSVSSTSIAYFPSIARTAIAVACWPVRFLADCSTVTSDKTVGDSTARHGPQRYR